MSDPLISLVVAMDRNRVIGLRGRLPWHLPADLAHFKRVTMGKPIIMGRRTHVSIGRPLPGRDNIVVTAHPEQVAAGCRVAGSLDEAVAMTAGASEVCIIGGASLFAEALPRAGRIYLTQVHAELKGDVWFPEFDREQWHEITRIERAADERNPYALSFVELARVP